MENIEPAIVGDDGADGRDHIGLLRQIGLHPDSSASRCFDGLGHPLRSGAVDIHDSDRCAFPGQGTCRRFTDSPGTARDDGRLSVQTSHAQTLEL